MANVFKVAKALWKKPGNKKKKWSAMVKEAGRKVRGKKTVKRKVKGVTASKRLRNELKKDKIRLTHGYATVKRSRVGSVSAHVAHAKNLIKENIGKLEASIFTATTQKSKREKRKRLNRLKSQYRKLC